MLFEDFSLEYEVLDGLESMNFIEATPIQEATIPLLLQGKDMIACAQTGTGKTAAYLLPILNKLVQGACTPDKVNALIMVPTRELAVQIEQQLDGFSYFMPISSVSIYGGTDGITFAQQQRGISQGVDIVIATPGRLLALLNVQKDADFSEVSYFVLDEADRMLDMGFMEDIQQIKAMLPNHCQTVMFSATMPDKIKRFAKSILKDPAEVEIAISRPPESIIQQVYICYDKQKVELVANFLVTHKAERNIIFCSSKLKCKEVDRRIQKLGIRTHAMHSDLDQAKREQVMRDFKAGKIDVLVATDIVARGIDIDNIELVINYDLPHDHEDYVHRIGRTARGNNDKGLALTLVGEHEQSGFAKLEDFLGKEIERLVIPQEFGDAPEYQPHKRTATRFPKRKAQGKRSRPHKGGLRNNTQRTKKVTK